jgi:hypothetical protein
MNNQTLLIAGALVLIGILGVVYIQTSHKSSGEKIADSIGEVSEEIVDEIDDNTDAR